jgi:DNA-directed RNA polymerase specialized sigma24 family protein
MNSMEETRTWLQRFLRPTRWSLVNRVRRPAQSDRVAADEFCRCYWYPLYAFLRRAGYSHVDAQDHVQSFLVHLLEENLLAAADPEKGRLRNFLTTLLTRHVAARRQRDGAQKRGGNTLHVPLEWEAAEASWHRQGRTAGSPDEAFRRALATRLVADGIAALRNKYAASDKLVMFEELLPALEGIHPDDTYAGIAARLGMRPGAVRAAAIRMRGQFRESVKSLASRLLGIPAGPRLDEELRDLFCSPTTPAGL